MRCDKGFTLIELIIVIFIMFVIANVLGFTLNNSDKRELNKAALELQSDLRLTQRLSIINRKEFQVSFNILNNSYQIKERISKTLPNYKVHKSVNLSNGIELVHISSGGSSRIRYTSAGTTSDPCTITLMSKSYMLKLTVNLGSGRVNIKKFIPV